MFSGKRLKLWQKRPSAAEQSVADKTASDGEKLNRSGRPKGKTTPVQEVVKVKSSNDRSAASRTNLSLNGEEESNELQRLRNDYVKLEETVHSLMPYRNKTEILEKRLLGVSETYDRDRGLYEATIDVLRSENSRLRAELQRTRAACARCSFCSRITSSSQTIESTGNVESLPRSVSSVEKVHNGEAFSPAGTTTTTSFRPSPSRQSDSSSSGGAGRVTASQKSKNSSPATRSQPRQRAAGVNKIDETSDAKQLQPSQRGARKPAEQQQQQRSPKSGTAAGRTGGKMATDATCGSDTTSTTSSASGMDAGKVTKTSSVAGRMKLAACAVDGLAKSGSVGIGRAKTSPRFGRERQSVKPQPQPKPQQQKASVVHEVARKTTRANAMQPEEKSERREPAYDKQKQLDKLVPVHEIRKSPDGAGTPEAVKSFNDSNSTLDGACCYNVQKAAVIGIAEDVGFRNEIASAERNVNGNDATKDDEFVEETEIVPYDDVIVLAAADADAMETSTLSSVQSSSRASTVSINDILDGDAVADLLSAEFEASLLGLAAAAAAGGGEARCSLADDVDGDGVEVESNVDGDSLGRLLLLNDGFARSALIGNHFSISHPGQQSRDKPILSDSEDRLSVKTTTAVSNSARENEQTAASREYRPWILRVASVEKPRSAPEAQRDAVIGRDAAGPQRQTSQWEKNEEATGCASSGVSRQRGASSIVFAEQFSNKASVGGGGGLEAVADAEPSQSNEIEEEQTCSKVTNCCFSSAPAAVTASNHNSLENGIRTNVNEERGAAVEKEENLNDKTDRREFKSETLHDAAQSQAACSDEDKIDVLSINHPQLSDMCTSVRMENNQRTNTNFSLSFDQTANNGSAMPYPEVDYNCGRGADSRLEVAPVDEGVVGVAMTTSLGSPDDGYSSHSQGSTIASVNADDVDGQPSPPSSAATFRYDDRRFPAPDGGPGKQLAFHRRRRSFSDAIDAAAVGKLSRDFPRQRSADTNDAVEVDISTDKVSALTAYFEDIHAEQCPGCQICLTGLVERPFVVVAHRRSSAPEEDRVSAPSATIGKINDSNEAGLFQWRKETGEELKVSSKSTTGVESEGLAYSRSRRLEHRRGLSFDESGTLPDASVSQWNEWKSQVAADSSSLSHRKSVDKSAETKMADSCQVEELLRKSLCREFNNSDTQSVDNRCSFVVMATASNDSSGGKASCRVTSTSLPDVSDNVAVLGSNPDLGRAYKTSTSFSAGTVSCDRGRHSPFRVSYFRSHSLKSFGEMADSERTRTGSDGNQLSSVAASAHARRAGACVAENQSGGNSSNRKLITKTPIVSDVEIRRDATVNFNVPPIDVTGNTTVEQADEPEAPLTPDVIQEKYRIDRKSVLSSAGTRLPTETSTVGAAGVHQGCKADSRMDYTDSDGSSSPWQQMDGKNNNAMKGKVDTVGECGVYDNFSCFTPASTANLSLSVKPPRVPRLTRPTIPDSGSSTTAASSTPQSSVYTSSASFPPTPSTSTKQQMSSPTCGSSPPGNTRLPDVTPSSAGGVERQGSPLCRWNSDDPDRRQRRPFAGSFVAPWTATSEPPPTDIWVPHSVAQSPLTLCGPAGITRASPPDQHQRRYSAEAAYTPPRRIVTTALQPIRNLDDSMRAKERFSAVGTAQQRKSTPPTGRKNIYTSGSLIAPVAVVSGGGGVTDRRISDICRQNPPPVTNESDLRTGVPELPGHISVCIGLSVQCAPLKSTVIQTAMPPPISSPPANRVAHLNRIPELHPNSGPQHRAVYPKLQHSWTDQAAPALPGRIETRYRPEFSNYYQQHLQHTRHYAAPGALSWYQNPDVVAPAHAPAYFADCKFPALVNNDVAVSHYSKMSPRRKAGTVTDYSSDSMERRDSNGSPDERPAGSLGGTNFSAEAAAFDGRTSAVVLNADESTTAFDEISQQIACLTRTVNELRSKYRGNEDLLAVTRPGAAAAQPSATTLAVMGSGGHGSNVGPQQQQFRGGKRR